MKIRGKLLSLLLVMALTPLLLTAIYGFVTVRNMGFSLAEQSGAALQAKMGDQLRLMVEYNARLLRQQRTLVEAWLELLAESVEQVLAADNPASEPAYLADDFDADRVPPAQIHASSRHMLLHESGKITPMPVSTRAQVLNLAPGVDADSVGDSVQRLSSLTHIYRSGYDQHPDLFYWIYTSLEDGVHSSFPGHGGYPPDYDGRKRGWYKQAVSTDGTAWSGLLVDATTKQAIATASRRVFYPDGRLAGVVAIDVPIQAMLNKVRLESELSQAANVFIAAAQTEDHPRSLYLLATIEGEHRDWREIPETRTLTIDHPVFVKTVDDIVAGESGVQRLPYKGEDSVWAYAAFQGSDNALVVVFPFTNVAARIKKAEDYVLSQTLGIISIIGVFVIVLTGLIIAAAWGSSRTITGPVRELAGAARRLAQGDFEVRVPVGSKDEIGQLGGVFNDIAPQLLDRLKAKESLAHLGRYFSPNLARQLTENPGLLEVGGERREMTFVFTDLAGFTHLVETSEPEHIVPVLNEYLDGMTRIVWEYEGTIDKVVGDAVHAMFGAPIDQPDHAARGIQCALAMDRYSESFRAGMSQRGTEIGITRIGINTGPATVGNFGGELMFDYTAHGDAINTAARLEGANKFFGTRIAVSENTTSKIEGFCGRPIGRLVLKGRSTGLMTFEPLSPDELASGRVQSYLLAYESMARRQTPALDMFKELSTSYPLDRLIKFHLSRLEAGEQGDVVVLAGK